MPEPKSFEHIRRALRWLVVAAFCFLSGLTVARLAVENAAANNITASGESLFVDAMLSLATCMALLTAVPVYIATRAILASFREHDEGYTRLWSAIVAEDLQRKLGVLPERQRPVPVTEPKTYSEMVYGKKETER